MKFHRITHELYGAKKAGYRLAMDSDRFIDDMVASALGSHRAEICLDSFYDFDGDLYETGNGDKYYVLMVYVNNEMGYKPFCWQKVEKRFEIPEPEMDLEISEIDAPLEEIIQAISRQYPGWKFSRTEKRYESCIMAIFEKC